MLSGHDPGPAEEGLSAMAVLDWRGPDRGLSLTGQGVKLRPPRITDYAQWSELRLRSRDFLQPWEPVWPTDDLTKSAFRRAGVMPAEHNMNTAVVSVS